MWSQRVNLDKPRAASQAPTILARLFALRSASARRNRQLSDRAKLAILCLLVACQRPPQDPCQEFVSDTQRCITLTTYQNKMRAAWLGQMVGVSYAQPAEFLYRGRTIPAHELPTWNHSHIKRAFFEDDLLVELSFVDALQQYGTSLNQQQLSAHFAQTKLPLWHANQAARERIRSGQSPSNQHTHASDIDYQIEADLSGLISPGMPHRVRALGALFGRMICDGECVDGGKFIGCLYAEAFFEGDLSALLDKALRCIPEEGVYAETIRDVIRWHSESPRDWRATWQKIEDKYNTKDSAHCKGDNPEKEGAGFNINASLNGAYVVAGLLYGDKDIEQTLQLTTQMGQDADCNASSALGVLFTILGEDKIPAQYRPEISPGWRFHQTEHTLASVLSLTEKLAREHIEQHAKLQRAKSGQEVFVLPVRP